MKITELACPNCGASLGSGFAPNQEIHCQHCGSVFLAEQIEAPTTVICPNCRTVNPIDERFCARCGDSLKVGCILCHTENPVGTIYCTNCGAHLENARARRKTMQLERQKLWEERNRLFKEKEARQRVEKLQRLLDDLDEPENHDFAIFQINQLGEEAIDALIETMLTDDDPDARYGSARALGQICNEHQIKMLSKARTAKALIQALEDGEHAVRYWAANALGKCRSHVAVESLAKLLGDKHEGVRKQAKRALERIGGPRVEEILAQTERKGPLTWIKGN
jgi:phage FluMu protein Com